jgi:hypothetical protein
MEDIILLLFQDVNRLSIALCGFFLGYAGAKKIYDRFVSRDEKEENL